MVSCQYQWDIHLGRSLPALHVDRFWHVKKMQVTWLLLLLCFATATLSSVPPVANEKELHHHDYAEMLLVMKETNERCPGITKLYNLTGKSVQGRDLAVIEFFDFHQGSSLGKPMVKYIGNIHGNEVVGRELLLLLMQYLCSQHTLQDSNVVRLLRLTSIHIMPSMNPDGWEIAANSIRQLGYSNGMTGRRNANGVDLNRNFPDLDAPLFNRKTHFNNHVLREIVYNKTQVQPETQAVVEWILGRPFVLSASFHGGDLVVNYPYDEGRGGQSIYSRSPDDTTFRQLSRAFSYKHRTMTQPGHPCRRSTDFGRQQGITNGAAWYSVAGGMQDFNYLATNCFELTIELGCVKFPTADILHRAWTDSREALISLIWQAHIGFKGRVVDAATGDALPNVAIHVKNLTSGEDIAHDVTTDVNGYYWRLVSNGDYLITYSTPGYKVTSRCLRVASTPFSEAVVVDVQLPKNSSSTAPVLMQDCRSADIPLPDGAASSDDGVVDVLQRLLQLLRD